MVVDTISGWMQTRGLGRGQAGRKGAAMGVAGRGGSALGSAGGVGARWEGLGALERRVMLSAVSFAVERVGYPTGSAPYSVTTADFNGDGKIDLAVANSGSNTVSVLLGDGSGGFGVKTDFATGAFPISVT